MTGLTHKRIGAATATVVATVALPTTLLAVLLVPAAYLTSTLPDRLERWVPCFMPWRWRPRLRFHLLPIVIHVRPLRHRRVTHYPETVVPAMILLAALAATIGPVLGVLAAGAAIGITMHLAADACTLTGIPSLTNVLRGQPDRRLHLLPEGHRFRTGSRNEHRARILFTLATVALVAGIVWLQGDQAPELDWRILAGIAVLGLLATAPVRQRLRTHQVRAAWMHAAETAIPEKSPSRAPRITRVRPCAVGYQGTVKLKGGSFDDLLAQRERLGAQLDRSGFRVRDLRLRPHPTRSSRATATVVLRDPFHNAPPTTSPLVQTAVTSVMRDPCPVGTFENGKPATIQWAPGRAGHILICGITEGGKSAFAQQLIAHTALDPEARLILLDPQQTQFARWQSCAALPVVGANTTDAIRALESVGGVLGHQLQTLADRGTWTPTHDDPTYTVVIDEAALYLRKDDRANSLKFATLLLDLLQRARAGGIRVITLTQRPSGEVFPTDLRAQYPWRVCFRVNEATTTQMVFEDRHTAPAHLIPKHGYQGVGYLDTETDQPERFRGHYLTPAQIDQIADRAAGTRIDHELLPGPLPLSSPSPGPKAAEQREQRDRATLLEVLPVTAPGFDRSQIESGVGSWRQVKRTLDLLVMDGLVIRDGAGRPGDPFRYRRAVQPGAQDRAQHANDGVEPDDGSVHGPTT